MCSTFQIHCDIHDKILNQTCDKTMFATKKSERDEMYKQMTSLWRKSRDFCFKFEICFEGMVALRCTAYIKPKEIEAIVQDLHIRNF